MEDRVKLELNESIQVKKNILERNVQDIIRFAHMVINAYRNDGRLIAFGNGGSAADAQHIVAELVNYLYNPSRPMLDALALTVNTSVITAIGNDIGFDNLFSKQIESLATPRDVILGISTSGNSENVIRGLIQAKRNGAKCVALVGKGGGKIKDLNLDLMINVNSDDTARIQEGHITIGHILCSLVEKELFQDKKIKFVSDKSSSVSSTAPVRISLANGGDTDDYIKQIGNGFVLNATLESHYYKCSLIPKDFGSIIVNTNNLYDCESNSYEIKNLSLDGSKSDLIKATLKRLNPKFKGDIVIETNVPMTSGMGGSSSLNVALIEALYKFDNQEYDKEEVARLAYDIERNDLGIKGGYQDQWAASYRGGINLMEFTLDGVKVNNLPLSEEIISKLENNLLLLYLEPRMSSGSDIHADQCSRIEKNPEKIKEILIHKRMNTLQAKEALLNGELDNFGYLLHKDFELKKELSSKVTTAFVDDVYNTALIHGALGGRVSGAGAGGVAFFYCPEDTKEDVSLALKQKGALVMPFKFERQKEKPVKLVLMVGGQGVRLQPLTYDIPKPMLPIKGKPMIEYHIEWAKKHGIKDIIICSGYLSYVVENHFGDGSRYGVNIKYSVEKEPLGTAGPLKLAKDIIGDSDFIMLHGDVLCKVDAKKLIDFHRTKNALCTIVVHPSSHLVDSDLIELDGNKKVIKFWNKPHEVIPPTELGNSGLHVFSSGVFDYIQEGKYSLEKGLLPDLVERKLEIFGYNTSEFLKDMGTFDRIEWMEKQIDENGWDLC
jgi:D-glycero-alpha-D-manno-heptose-7-phosphate kinase